MSPEARSRRTLDAADKIDESSRKYFQSEKGRTALARAQKNYYSNKKKPVSKLVRFFLAWQEENPGKPIEDFLEELKQ